MLTLLSPSKTLNEKPDLITREYSIPEFLHRSSELVNILRTYSPAELGKLMNINSRISNLNAERYMKWKLPFDTSNANRSILMFKGEVYNGLKAETFTEENLLFAQEHIRILSGLYGVLKPLDLIQPYRLEMGTRLNNDKWKDLYEFWSDALTERINTDIEDHDEKVIVNLASDEYFHSLDPSKLKAKVLKCQFKEEREGKLKFITIFGKKARGLMTRFIIDNNIDRTEDLKAFDRDGYYFNPDHSTENMWLFTR